MQDRVPVGQYHGDLLYDVHGVSENAGTLPYATLAEPPELLPKTAVGMVVSVMTGVTAAAASAADAAQVICRQLPLQ